MRKMILFESQPAPCQPPRRSRLLRAPTPLLVLAATTALLAVQLGAQATAPQSPSKPAAAGVHLAPAAPTASKTLAPAAANPQTATKTKTTALVALKPAAPATAKTPASAATKPQSAANSKTTAHTSSKPAANKPVRKQANRRKQPAKEKSLATKAPITPAPVQTPPTPQPPHWPANERPADASVTWDSHGLLITAQNSSLKQILDDVSAATGAKVEGLGADQRIFGAYGPGKAREVLSQLLDGTGYNVLMIGDQGEGTPRQIVLTSRNGSTTTQAAAANPAPPAPNAAEEDPDPNDEPAEDNGARRLGRHGPDHNDPGAPPRP
ncbi:MAG: hypothetical protein ACLQLH_08115 [Terracidiphilus sp.]